MICLLNLFFHISLLDAPLSSLKCKSTVLETVLTTLAIIWLNNQRLGTLLRNWIFTIFVLSFIGEESSALW